MTPSAVTEAVTVVLPVLTPDTTPFSSTVATWASSLAQVTIASPTPVATDAVNWLEVPIFSVISS